MIVVVSVVSSSWLMPQELIRIFTWTRATTSPPRIELELVHQTDNTQPTQCCHLCFLQSSPGKSLAFSFVSIYSQGPRTPPWEFTELFMLDLLPAPSLQFFFFFFSCAREKRRLTCHRVNQLRPQDTEDDPYFYTFKVQCTSCREVHPNWISFTRFVRILYLPRRH